MKKKHIVKIMVKSESGEYVSSEAIPKGDYVLNEEKTICENGGKVVSYNSITGQIGFSFLGSDRCSLYFDKIIDTEKPVISNLSVNDTTITSTLTDNIELSGYGISTSNSTEPTSWTPISGTSYNLSITITTEGTYYLWVKDSSDNKTLSEVIDLEKKGYQTILINNGGGATTVDASINYIKEKGTPNFTTTATTNEGMFAAEDDLGTSYYFRGAVDNNWVKFGKDSSNNDMYWRIIRINGDGSIRMIYTGTTASTDSTKVVMTGEGTQIGMNVFNNHYFDLCDVGYMYNLAEQHGINEDSIIKKVIDNWYETTTLRADENTKNLIADEIYCNDRAITSGSSVSTGDDFDYASYTRIYVNSSNPAPTLKCTNASDRFTVNASKGNGALTYPVGLITADEIMLAGADNQWNSNSSYYLYTGQSYWPGSPLYWDRFYANSFIVGHNGSLDFYYVSTTGAARGVISLSSESKLLGSGTYNDVYTVN